MPRNNQSIPRADRLSQLLDAAEELLLLHGFGEMTTAAVARSAGVAPNAVVWYFPTRDDLLAEVLQRAFATIKETIEHRPRSTPATRLIAVANQWKPRRSIYAAMLSRLMRSQKLAELHHEMLHWFKQLADVYIADLHPERPHPHTARTLVVILEACILNGYDGRRFRTLIEPLMANSH